MEDIINTNTDKVLVRRLKKELATNQPTQNQNAEKPWHSQRTSATSWQTRIAQWLAQPMQTTPQRLSIYEDLVAWIPKTLSLQESVATLEMLNMLAARSHAASVKQFRHIVGITNHCIDMIHKATGLSWNEIFTNYGSKFEKLLDKLTTNGMDGKLLRPTKQTTAPLTQIDAFTADMLIKAAL